MRPLADNLPLASLGRSAAKDRYRHGAQAVAVRQGGQHCIPRFLLRGYPKLPPSSVWSNDGNATPIVGRRYWCQHTSWETTGLGYRAPKQAPIGTECP